MMRFGYLLPLVPTYVMIGVLAYAWRPALVLKPAPIRFELAVVAVEMREPCAEAPPECAPAKPCLPCRRGNDHGF